MPLVHDSLERHARRMPGKTALVCGERRVSYGDLEAMANRLAWRLRRSGVQRGDRVLLWLPNDVELVVALFAVLKANAVFVVANQSSKRDKLGYLARHSHATALICESRRHPLLSDIRAHAPSVRTIVLTGPPAKVPGTLDFAAIQSDANVDPPPREATDQDLACLIYTSGSTGEPKGVMSAHENVDFVASSIIGFLQNAPDDVVLNVLPLSFDYGLYQLLMTVRFGGTLVLEKGFAYPAHILQRLQAERVTGFPGVPTVFAMLLQLDLTPYNLSRLRYLTNTAAALPTSHLRELRRRLPWVTVYSMYGLTETKRTLYLPPDQLERRPESVGIAIPGTEVWLEDETGRRLGPNEVGELIVRGRHVMRGYWEDPEATALRFRPGPLPGERVCHSGDLFRMDEEGYFYFVARKDDIIKSRGEKVAPREIENVLYALHGVVEAAAVGVPDPLLGQAIEVLIVSRDDRLSERDVLRHCREHLEDFMVPKFVTFCRELPKTSSGKISRTALGASSRTS